MSEKKILYDEEPTTKFVDQQDAVRVTLVNWPDVNRSKKTLVDFVEASWNSEASRGMNKKEIDKTIDSLIRGNALPLGLETMKFTFLIENISLHISHSIVRARVGAVFSQMSQATTDLRHSSIVVPRSFSKVDGLTRFYEMWCEEGKRLYACALDSKKIATQDARMCLPKGVCNHIYMSADLLALQNFIGKRLCEQEEPVELNIIAESMRKQVIKKFPFLKGYLVSVCSLGRCLHQKTGAHANVVFKRDKLHANKNAKNEITLHSFTRNEMISGKKYV